MTRVKCNAGAVASADFLKDFIMDEHLTAWRGGAVITGGSVYKQVRAC